MTIKRRKELERGQRGGNEESGVRREGGGEKLRVEGEKGEM